jgi:hypothetical protein
MGALLAANLSFLGPGAAFGLHAERPAGSSSASSASSASSSGGSARAARRKRRSRKRRHGDTGRGRGGEGAGARRGGGGESSGSDSGLPPGYREMDGKHNAQAHRATGVGGIGLAPRGAAPGQAGETGGGLPPLAALGLAGAAGAAGEVGRVLPDGSSRLLPHAAHEGAGLDSHRAGLVSVRGDETDERQARGGEASALGESAGAGGGTARDAGRGRAGGGAGREELEAEARRLEAEARRVREEAALEAAWQRERRAAASETRAKQAEIDRLRALLAQQAAALERSRAAQAPAATGGGVGEGPAREDQQGDGARGGSGAAEVPPPRASPRALGAPGCLAGKRSESGGQPHAAVAREPAPRGGGGDPLANPPYAEASEAEAEAELRMLQPRLVGPSQRRPCRTACRERALTALAPPHAWQLLVSAVLVQRWFRSLRAHAARRPTSRATPPAAAAGGAPPRPGAPAAEGAPGRTSAAKTLQGSGAAAQGAGREEAVAALRAALECRGLGDPLEAWAFLDPEGRGLVTRARLAGELARLQARHIDADRLLFALNPRDPSGALARAEFLAALRGALPGGPDAEPTRAADDAASLAARANLRHIRARVAARIAGRPAPAAPAPGRAEGRGGARERAQAERVLSEVRRELRARGLRSVAEAFVVFENMPGEAAGAAGEGGGRRAGLGLAGGETVAAEQIAAAACALDLASGAGGAGALLAALGLDAPGARASYRAVAAALGWAAAGMGADAWDANAALHAARRDAVGARCRTRRRARRRARARRRSR